MWDLLILLNDARDADCFDGCCFFLVFLPLPPDEPDSCGDRNDARLAVVAVFFDEPFPFAAAFSLLIEGVTAFAA